MLKVGLPLFGIPYSWGVPVIRMLAVEEPEEKIVAKLGYDYYSFDVDIFFKGEVPMVLNYGELRPVRFYRD